MILQNETETVKNLQYRLDLFDNVILYDVNFHTIRWVGFVIDIPLEYLHCNILSEFTYDINVPNRVGRTLYIK